MYKGIFWFTGDGLLAVKVLCGADGTPLESADFSAKTGENFNHRTEWAKLPKRVTAGWPFDYWPRGRVEIKSGRVVVYLHPSLNQEPALQTIRREFGLDGVVSIRVVSDGSTGSTGCGKKSTLRLHVTSICCSSMYPKRNWRTNFPFCSRTRILSTVWPMAQRHQTMNAGFSWPA